MKKRTRRKANRGISIRYYQVIHGKVMKWYRMDYPSRCQANIFLDIGCQGCQGHVGECWAYKPDGTYVFAPAKDDPRRKNFVVSFVPPSSKHWISPKVKEPEYYVNMHKTYEVKEPKKIAQLNRDKCELGAIIDRPVNDDEIIRLLQER